MKEGAKEGNAAWMSNDTRAGALVFDTLSRMEWDSASTMLSRMLRPAINPRCAEWTTRGRRAATGRLTAEATTLAMVLLNVRGRTFEGERATSSGVSVEEVPFGRNIIIASLKPGGVSAGSVWIIFRTSAIKWEIVSPTTARA